MIAPLSDRDDLAAAEGDEDIDRVFPRGGRLCDGRQADGQGDSRPGGAVAWCRIVVGENLLMGLFDLRCPAWAQQEATADV